MGKNLGSFNSAATSEIIKVVNQKTHNFTIISTNVSPSITVRIESSNDAINFSNVTTQDCVISLNEENDLVVTENLPINFLRFKYVSGTGDAQVYYTNY